MNWSQAIGSPSNIFCLRSTRTYGIAISQGLTLPTALKKAGYSAFFDVDDDVPLAAEERLVDVALRLRGAALLAVLLADLAVAAVDVFADDFADEDLLAAAFLGAAFAVVAGGAVFCCSAFFAANKATCSTSKSTFADSTSNCCSRVAAFLLPDSKENRGFAITSVCNDVNMDDGLSV